MAVSPTTFTAATSSIKSSSCPPLHPIYAWVVDHAVDLEEGNGDLLKTQKRTIKASGHWYREFCRKNALSPVVTGNSPLSRFPASGAAMDSLEVGL